MLCLKDTTMKLIEINSKGELVREIQNLPEIATDVLSSTKQLYEIKGYSPPWGGYLAIEDGICVGTCGFKSVPYKNRVEIAYYTFPGNEGRGVATRMTRCLIDIALKETPEITVAAQTLTEENASTAVLRKNGFQFVNELEHPEDGKVWEWHLLRHET